ncbi:hypothetical protein KVT40_001832 [Elsinoe batatas]|uniref:Amidohydrolase-related domain-containing protein n=1 Tax=Elsinoe batatas TaxID=2601811 RepID=A0A8K0L8S7_9PEZI|nr:hypothetical protein KVT40_001832 [Elsinoe batatas]
MVTRLFENGTVITFDEGTQSVEVLPRASIQVEDDRIRTIEEDAGKLADISKRHDLEVINVEGRIICPGFVNTHVHSWQTVLRTLGPNVILASYFDWVSQMSPTVREAFTPEDIYISALEGYLEGLNAGVTSYVEHAHNNWNTDVVDYGYAAATDSGARVWWCYDISHREHFSEEVQWDKLRETSSKTNHDSTVLPGVALDSLAAAALSKPNGTLEPLIQNAKEMKLQAMTVHHVGSPWPQGNTSPSKLCDRNIHKAEVPVIFSHASSLTDADMQALRDHDLYTSITPESECHFGHGQISGKHISDQASLGIDTAWTFSGDMITQARLWLQIVRKQNYERTLATGLLPNANPMEVEQAFLLATRQGGKALRRDDIGVLKVGAKADIVIFNGDSPNMLGWSDPMAAIILHANAGDIEHVLVDGKFRKRDFKPVDGGAKLSWAAVKARFVEAARRIQPQLKTVPPLPDKLWGFGEFGHVEKVSTIRCAETMAVYVVTGTAKGLGLELTKQLSELPDSQVSKIFAITRSQPSSALQELIKKNSDRIENVIASLNDTASVEKAADAIKSKAGKVDVLINNAAMQEYSSDNKTATFTPELMNKMFDTNITGPHRVIRSFLPLLKAGSEKKVINISSTLGSVAWADGFALAPGQAYKISKSALHMLNKQYAIDHADEGFTFLCISPGWLKTDLTGGMGDFTVDVGAKGVIEHILNADKSKNGKFVNVHVPGHENDYGKYDGQEVPW